MERLENLNLLETLEGNLCDEWVAYLASLKSVNTKNVYGENNEYEDCVNVCLDLKVYTNYEEVNPVKNQKLLTELLQKGYNVVEVKNNRLVLSKSENLTLEQVVDVLRENVRPYRTLYLHASRLDSERVMKVLERAQQA